MKTIIKNRAFIFENLFSSSIVGKLNGYWDRHIKKLAKGRYDFYLNSDESLLFLKPPILVEFIERNLGSEYQYYTGALISEPDSEGGEWHADAELFGEVDWSLPPYYFTLLVPLHDITPSLGGTEIGQAGEILLKAGDALLLDGRVLHRGVPNKSHVERRMFYAVFCKNWYYED